ncbi:FeS-binding protein [Candidatus Bathyarchaeota archaeon]|nr:FeS-binding protein [Candidatus Bathyarchaeota archaeon]
MTLHPNFDRLLKENFKVSIVSTNHLAELEQEIKSRWNKGEFNEEFSREYLPRFKFAPPPELANAQSLIVVAMPRPLTRAIFMWKGKSQSFILPPTYTAYDEKRIYVERAVAEEVGKYSYKVATAMLPLKLLAVRSRLAKYGRNNIAYVSGMGSFMRLTAVYSDKPCENDSWQEARVMKRCETCDICSKACPTSAIAPDRFLLRAEKCLTYHNEKKGSIPFPKWIKPSWHNCIIGCIRCQAACPENKQFLQWVGETAEFDEAETKLLLKGVPIEQIPASTMEKMKLLSLTDYFDMLPRNLSALLK